MPPPIETIDLPGDVIEYIRTVFASAHDGVAARLEGQPNVHEEALDMALISFISTSCGPHRTASDTVVDIDVHFVGGGWHIKRWEVADIGLLIIFRRRGQVLRRKVVLLQSKRLYPREVEFVETHGLAWPGGFGSLARMADGDGDIRALRTFRFDEECRYKALQLGDIQWQKRADSAFRSTISSTTPASCRFK